MTQRPDPDAQDPALDEDLAEFFVGRGERPQRPAEVGALGDVRQEFLLFALGTEWFALPVPQLREIVMPPPLSEVPRAKPSVRGVTMIRGEVVPVVDPRAALRLDARVPQAAGRVVVVDAGQGPVGVWVDRVIQVVRVLGSQLEDPPAGVAGEGDAVVRLGRLGEKLYGVLDLAALLHRVGA